MNATALSLVARRPAFAPFCFACGAKLPLLRAGAIACPHCGDDLVRSDGTRASRSRLRPWLAAASSLLLPGLGQVLNGEPRKGVLVLLTCWLIVPWAWGVVDAWRGARKAALATVRPLR